MCFQCEAITKVFDHPDHPAKLHVRDTGAGWTEKEKELPGFSDRAVDLSLFATSDLDRHKLSDKEREKSQAKEGRKAWLSKMIWSLVRVPIEIKTGSNVMAPFSGSNSETSREARGQLAEYVAKINISQHRTSTLAVAIHRQKVYLTRWERSGVVIAKPIDLTTEPEKFFLFVYRVGQMSDAELGYDPTVQKVEETDADVVGLRAFKPALGYQQKYMAEAFPVGSKGPIHRVVMKDKDGKEHRLLIGRPRHASRSAFGRGTKGFVAYDVGAKALRFLKDYWRPDTKGHTTEYEIYVTLHAKGVRNIATLVCGGDVYSPEETVAQRTRAQKYLAAYETPRIHHRIVVVEVGRPLEEYANSRELCRVVYGALCGKLLLILPTDQNAMLISFHTSAHQDAWTKAEILHRDISPGNIIISEIVSPDTGKSIPKGMLNDWDMAKSKKQLSKPPTAGNRSVSTCHLWRSRMFFMLCVAGYLGVHVRYGIELSKKTFRAGRRPGIVHTCPVLVSASLSHT